MKVNPRLLTSLWSTVLDRFWPGNRGKEANLHARAAISGKIHSGIPDQSGSAPIDLLTLWRSWPPIRSDATLSQRKELILAAACRLSPILSDDQKDALRELLTEQNVGRAAFRLACLLPNAHSDLVGTLLLIASLEGHPGGTLALAQLLIREAEVISLEAVDEGEKAIEYAEHLRARAISFLADEGTSAISRPHYWVKEISEAIAPRVPPEKPVKRNIPTPLGPRLTVMTAIGHSFSSEGRNLTKAYEVLTKPLPLSPVPMNIDVIETVLKLEAPNFHAAVNMVTEQLALLNAVGQPALRLKPVLFLGPPACGKTRFALRLAELLGAASASVGVAGSTDDRMLRGTARGWSSAQPCWPLMVMTQTGHANPVLVVDELEKVSPSRTNGNIWDTLLLMLEPTTARRWQDECLLARCNLSQISWVFTANTLDLIPRPLLDRLIILEIAPAGPEHAEVLLHSILRGVADDLGVGISDLPKLPTAAFEMLRKALADGCSIRAVQRAAYRLLAQNAEEPRLLH